MTDCCWDRLGMALAVEENYNFVGAHDHCRYGDNITSAYRKYP